MDIIKHLIGGKQYSTADIYKALGGKKSKDVRPQLDELYKQGVVERNKVSNSYFWNLRDENDDELEEPKISENGDFQNLLIKQLKDEIRFLRGTISDLIKLKKIEQQTPSHITPTMAMPSNTQSVIAHVDTSVMPNIPTTTPLAPHTIDTPAMTTNNYQTPKRTFPASQLTTNHTLPVNNRFDILSVEETAPSQPATDTSSENPVTNSSTSNHPSNLPCTPVSHVNNNHQQQQQRSNNASSVDNTNNSSTSYHPSNRPRTPVPHVNNHPNNDRLVADITHRHQQQRNNHQQQQQQQQ